METGNPEGLTGLRAGDIARLVGGARVVPRGGGGRVTRIAARPEDGGPDALFVCIRGVSADGHAFAGKAVAAGCRILVVERELPEGADQVVVPDARRALALVAAALAGDPSRRLRVFGVTGTNGKTTSAYLMRAVLEAAGLRSGLVGTVESIVGGHPVAASHTTPGPDALQHLFARMLAEGDEACAMEVSSHALSQQRVAGVHFAAAVFTNLTQDHLDYHAGFEEYFQAKRLLFAPSAGPAPPGAANADDAYGARLVDELGLLRFGVDAPADVTARDVRMDARGTEATVVTPAGEVALRTRLAGRYNLSNCLGVIAGAHLMGLPPEAAVRGIAGLPGVPGRMEPIDAGQPFSVLVDYAHTPDSLENVLRAARGFAGRGRVIVVFGCGGDRDAGKRPQMGRIARELADVAVVTSDNPRSEAPVSIIDQIVSGATRGGDLRVEPDRRAAIALAVELARDDDVVVIAGKGHERGQEVAGVVTPFDDRDVAREVLAGRAEGW